MPCTGNQPGAHRQRERWRSGRARRRGRRGRGAASTRTASVGGTLGAACRQRAEGHAGEARDKERDRHQQQRGREAVRDHPAHGLTVDEGRPEVAADDVPRVHQELLEQRTIEAELRPDERIVGRRRRARRPARPRDRPAPDESEGKSGRGGRPRTGTLCPSRRSTYRLITARACDAAQRLQEATSAKSPVHALKPAQRTGHARVLTVSTSHQ